MLIVQDILISDDVVEQQFLCNLSACKGACCWEGDFGAPLEDAEIDTLKRIYPDVKPFLSPAGIAVIEAEGTSVYLEETEDFATPLLDGGPCAYMTYDALGVAKCGIEMAYKAGATDFKKPISCHLYPIRIHKAPHKAFEALNYDRWDICSAACELGEKEQLPVYKFLKEALVRKYGSEFFEELDAAANHLKS